MDTVDSWTQSVFAMPPVMCGRQLQPFSLSHSLLLRAIGCPYAFTNADATRNDLLTAVEVCSRKHSENAAHLFGGGIRLFRLVYRSLRWGGMDFATADESFRTYIADFTRMAERVIVGDGSDPMSAPTEFHLHRHLCEVMHMTEADAWDCSVARAWAYFDTWSEWKGGKGLVGGRSAQVAHLNAQMEAASAKGDAVEVDRVWELMKALDAVKEVPK